MNIVFLQLGSNLGDRELLLQDAIVAIDERVGGVLEKSKVYESVPWRVEGQKNYLNQLQMVQLNQQDENVQFQCNYYQKVRMNVENQQKWDL